MRHNFQVSVFAETVLSVMVCCLLCGCLSIPRDRGADRSAQCKRDQAFAEQLRGHKIEHKIEIRQVSKAEVRGSFSRELDKPENRLFISQTERLMKQLRVIGAEDCLADIYLGLMCEEVAAYYDPEQKSVSYVDGLAGAGQASEAGSSLTDSFVYVHEFCHAVDDSAFGLDPMSKASLVSFDRSQALTCLVEGDAVLVGMDGLLSGMPVNTATPMGSFFVRALARVDLGDTVEKTMTNSPSFLNGALIRPYLDGGAFVNSIRRDGGWRCVDEVFLKRTPKSTAEILFPERRYFGEFTPVGFRPDEHLFNLGVKTVTTNCLGAMGIALWLDESCGGGGAPSRLSFLEGWLGDEMLFVEGPGGGVREVVWLSQWESAVQAWRFMRRAEAKIEKTFDGAPCGMARRNGLVALVFPGLGRSDMSRLDCERRAAQFVQSTEVSGGDAGGTLLSALNGLPWPIRWREVGSHCSALEVLGGHVAEVRAGDGFLRLNLADGLLMRFEKNPDRHYYGLAGDSLRHVRDSRTGQTFWKVPVLCGWFSREEDRVVQYKWNVLWGLGASGDEGRSRVLGVPVWCVKER